MTPQQPTGLFRVPEIFRAIRREGLRSPGEPQGILEGRTREAWGRIVFKSIKRTIAAFEKGKMILQCVYYKNRNQCSKISPRGGIGPCGPQAFEAHGGAHGAPGTNSWSSKALRPWGGPQGSPRGSPGLPRGSLALPRGSGARAPKGLSPSIVGGFAIGCDLPRGFAPCWMLANCGPSDRKRTPHK